MGTELVAGQRDDLKVSGVDWSRHLNLFRIFLNFSSCV